MAQVAPYGSWRSPISPALVVADSVTPLAVVPDGEDVYWIEFRPAERGRSAIVRCTPDGRRETLTPEEMNARTRVHEYGGGAYTVSAGTVYFANFADQRLYRQGAGGAPEALTPAGAGLRYADLQVDDRRRRILCVREDHSGGGEAVNTIVAVPLDGGAGEVLVAGGDFYAAPRLSPDGSRLAWLTWNHPNMPWDGTSLWVANLGADGALLDAHQVAGGVAESICEPEWAPDGTLYFVSDRTGWWNLYRLGSAGAEPVLPMAAEFGGPAWVFGTSTYAFTGASEAVCAYNHQGTWRLLRLDLATGSHRPIDLPYTSISNVRAAAGRVVFTGSSASSPVAVIQLDPATGAQKVLRRATEVPVAAGYLSVPQAVEFPTSGGLSAHAFYYPPCNQDFTAPKGERPPLLVKSHGGPTSATSAVFNLELQYWTSRGFAVLDVNYGGSTGYGRPYRERLDGNWGVVDVDDCCNGALYLARQGLADSKRLAITGGSAGGYTTLAALTFRDVFQVGASHFGVSDIETLAKETHKFESHYMDSLVGPYPAAQELYRQRSPIHYTDRLGCPVIFFQGLDDKVVPPNQAELMVDALRKKGLPVAYVAFAGEGHGFRKAENIMRTLEAQLYFFARTLGFAPAGTIEPVAIDNLP